jgi:hypothetical protein
LSYALDNEEYEGLVDPRLEKNYVESEVFRLIEVAAACVRHSSAKRPRMGQVIRISKYFLFNLSIPIGYGEIIVLCILHSSGC